MDGYFAPAAAMLANKGNYFPTKASPVVLAGDNPGALAANPGGLPNLLAQVMPSRAPGGLTLDGMLGPQGRQFLRNNTMPLAAVPDSDPWTLPSRRHNRVVVPYAFEAASLAAKQKPGQSTQEVLRPPYRFELALAYCHTRVSEESLQAPGQTWRPSGEKASLTRKDRLGITGTQMGRFHMNKDMLRSLIQFNYSEAMLEASDYSRATSGAAGAYAEFVRTRNYVQTPRAKFHALNLVDGVIFESEEIGDVLPSASLRKEEARAMTIIGDGLTHMWNYTKGAGVTEFASVNLIVRRMAVTARTRYTFHRYDEVEGMDETKTIPLLRTGDTIYPLQVCVLCWPDGSTPPYDYRLSWRYPAKERDPAPECYDGLIIPLGNILHRAHNGTSRADMEYTEPPTPEALTQVNDMAEATRSTIEVVMRRTHLD